VLIDMLFLYFISPPFLCVFGDDCVILYMGAEEARGDATDV